MNEDFGFYSGMTAVVLLLCAGMGFVIHSAVEQEKEWDAFKVAHACKAVQRTEARSVTTTSIGPKGQVMVGTGLIPGQVGWLCDDEITYWR